MFHVEHYFYYSSIVSSSSSSFAVIVTFVTIWLSFNDINLTPWVLRFNVDILLTSSLITIPLLVVIIISSSPTTDLNATIKPFYFTMVIISYDSRVVKQ